MTDKTERLPILYSLRNCPYAMRARIAIYKAKQTIMLRDVVLSNKPSEMVAASPKATVPVLILPNGTVIEESLEVMVWALKETDPDNLLHQDSEQGLSNILDLINLFDDEFKPCLEQYKCAKRYRESNLEQCREKCERYIQQLEARLTQHQYVMSDKESLADIALLPYIRQFARVERQWYQQSPYRNVRLWLNTYLQSQMFSKVMTKYPLWLDNHEVVFFGGDSK